MRLPFAPIPRAGSGDEERTAEALRLHEEALRAWVRRWINDIYPWPEGWIRLDDPAGPFDPKTAWGRQAPLVPGGDDPHVGDAGDAEELPTPRAAADVLGEIGSHAPTVDPSFPPRRADAWAEDSATSFERLEAATPDVSPLAAARPAIADPARLPAPGDASWPAETGSATRRLWLRKVPLWMPLAPQTTGFAPVPILPGLLLPSPGPEWIPLEGARDAFARPFAWRRGDTLALGWDPFHLAVRSLLLLEEEPGAHPDDLPSDPPVPSWEHAWVDRQWDWIWEQVAGPVPLPDLSRTVLPRLRPHLAPVGASAGPAAVWITRERRASESAEHPASTARSSLPGTVFTSSRRGAPARCGLLAAPGAALDEAAMAHMAAGIARRNGRSPASDDHHPGRPGIADDDPAPRLVRVEDAVFHAQRMPRNLSKAGFRIDSSVSLGCHPGFRMGTARPFAWFDIWSGRVLALVEAPPSVVIPGPPPLSGSRLERLLPWRRPAAPDEPDALNALPAGGIAALDAVAQEVRHVRGLLVVALPAETDLAAGVRNWLDSLVAEGWCILAGADSPPA